MIFPRLYTPGSTCLKYGTETSFCAAGSTWKRQSSFTYPKYRGTVDLF